MELSGGPGGEAARIILTRLFPKDASSDLLNYMTYAYLTPTGVEEIDYVYASRGKVRIPQ